MTEPMAPDRDAGELRTRTRIRWLLIAFLVVLVVIVLLGWAFRKPGGELPGFHARLASAAESAGRGGTVSMTELAVFEWDTVYAFPPYNDVSSVEEKLGFAWSPMSPAATLVFGNLFLANEGLTLLVFVTDDGEVTGWTILGTEYLEQPYIEMSADGRAIALVRENSTLVVTQPEFVSGPDAYLLVPTQ